MVSHDTLRTAVGVLGNMSTIMLALSPLPTFYSIWKKRSVEQFSPIPYIVSVITCMMWVLYGLPFVHPHSILIITTCGSSLVIELFYVFLFLLYSQERKRLEVFIMLLASIVIVGVVALLVMTLAHTHERRSMIVGILAAFCSILMYAAPLSVMIPNCVGILLATAQLFLYAMYYKSTQKHIEARRRKEEMAMTEVVVMGNSGLKVDMTV